MRSLPVGRLTARTTLALILLLLLATRLASRERRPPAFAVPADAAVTEWPTADGVAGAHYSSLADITPDNVAALEVAWVHHTGDVNDGRDGRSATACEAPPLMLHGTHCSPTPGSRLVALAADTG